VNLCHRPARAGALALAIALLATGCAGSSTTLPAEPSSGPPASGPVSRPTQAPRSPSAGALNGASAASPGTSPPAALADETGWIAYQGENGEQGLFLLRSDGSSEHRILGDLPGMQRHPDFSRDGRRLAFDNLPSEDSVDSVWVAAADGSGARMLKPDCPSRNACLGFWEPAWSPDGGRLAVVIEEGPTDGGVPNNFGIAIVDVATGHSSLVVETPATDGQLQFPRWSADGKRLLFWRESDQPTVWVTGVNGKGSRRLTAPALLAGEPDWSPDGKTIVFDTRPLLHFDSGPSDLYLVAPDGSGLRKITDSAAAAARYTQPKWTPNSRAILYTREINAQVGRPFGRQIWVLSDDARTDARIPAAGDIQTHPDLQATP
jgi:Tol biopolymer transport system component